MVQHCTVRKVHCNGTSYDSACNTLRHIYVLKRKHMDNGKKHIEAENAYTTIAVAAENEFV